MVPTDPSCPGDRWGVGREYWAKGEYRSVVNEMADSGVPITTTQIYDRYTAAETDEQSAEWTELFDAVTALREMSRDSVEGLDDLVPPDESWPAEPFAALMSKEAQPLIQKLEDLLKSDAPIPGEVTFSSRRLWMSGSNYGAIPELLEDEFQMAYHSGDTERAITLVRQWSQFIELLGQSNGFQAWSQWSLSKRWLRLVRQSVTHAFWNEEQLTELVALTNEIRGPISTNGMNLCCRALWLGIRCRIRGPGFDSPILTCDLYNRSEHRRFMRWRLWNGCSRATPLNPIVADDVIAIALNRNERRNKQSSMGHVASYPCPSQR